MVKKYQDKLELAAIGKALKGLEKEDMGDKMETKLRTKPVGEMCKCPECGYEATEETFKSEAEPTSGEGEAEE